MHSIHGLIVVFHGPARLYWLLLRGRCARALEALELLTQVVKLVLKCLELGFIGRCWRRAYRRRREDERSDAEPCSRGA